MAYARFDGEGYTYYNEKKDIIFCADNTHVDLFNYVNEDLSHFPKLLEQYFLQKIDTTTFSLTDLPSNDDILTEIKEMLINIHPYYIYEWRKAIINAIGNYFNSLLAYSIFRIKLLPLTRTLDKQWYIDRITFLMSPLLQAGESYHEKFYNKYKNWVEPNEYKIDEILLFNIPSQKPIGFNEEIKTQNMIYNMLYFILDISLQDLRDLTIPQRAWIYENIFHERNGLLGEMSIEQQFSFLPPILYSDTLANSQKSDNKNTQEINEIYEVFNPLYGIRVADIRHNGIPQNIMTQFKYAIDYAKNKAPDKISKQYKIDNLYQLLYLEIISMMQSNDLIRKCKNCGKYFVAKNRKIAYCNRMDDSGIPCSAIGSRRSFERKMEQDEALKIYTRAYKTHHARVKKKKMSINDLNIWHQEAKANLEKVRIGALDISTFQEWLKK